MFCMLLWHQYYMTNNIEYVYRRTSQNSGEEARKMLGGEGGREIG